MNRDELRELSKIRDAKAFLGQQQNRSLIQSSNPAVTAQQGERDSDRGTYSLTVGEGTIQADLIARSGGVAVGDVLPSTILSPTGNYADGQ